MKTKLATFAAAAALALGAALTSTSASAYTENPILKGGYYGSYGHGYGYDARYCFPVYSYGFRWVHGAYGWYKDYYKVFVGYRCKYGYYYKSY